MHPPPPSPAKANVTLMTECTPESSGCYSVYSVGRANVFRLFVLNVFNVGHPPKGLIVLYRLCRRPPHPV